MATLGVFPGAFAATRSALPASRHFYLGMTPLPYDFTPAAIEDTYRILGRHVDLVAHHMDEGVPWAESLAGTAYDANVENDIETRVRNTPAGKKVFLSVTPIAIDRQSLAGVWGRESHMPRTGTWAAAGFDDPDVIRAFLNYCRRLIERFKPSYLAYAIEVSDLIKVNTSVHKSFVTLAREVYTALKAEYPQLPLFPTFVLGNAEALDAQQRRVLRDLAPYTDILAVSTWPYVWDGVGGDPTRMGPDWFARVRAIMPAKPFAVSETGFIAGTFSLLKHMVYIPSSANAQASYVEFLLSEANRLGAEFVVWYVPVDYDRLWNKMKSQGANPWFEQWRTCGLYDAQMRPRKALQLWDSWLRLPRS